MKQTYSNQLFMMLRAKQFLNRYDIIQDESGNFNIRYSFDYTNPYDRHYFISCTDALEDCALLHQLSQVIPSDKSYDIDSVNTALIFVDFEDVFNRLRSSRTTATTQSNYKGADLLPTSKTIDNNYRLQTMFRNGFQVKYSDTLTITYIPFEKSNSMSRNSKMSFIAKELYDEINPRLHLDIPFAEMNITLSKFFAYKGLYLSSGNRVTNDNLLLNEETVIVIGETTFPILNQPIITAKQLPNSNRWEIREETKEKLTISNPFDGEGLISPAYAGLINDVLYKNEKKATSFQIRMPFTKGMLHQVDFKQFLAEHTAPNTDNGYYIKDAFGCNRDLNKAEIIMSVTMFKCFSWIKEHVATFPEDTDPMKFYFDMFRKYEHALYITNTNLGIKRTGFTTLNYQFLNTLALTKIQLDHIAASHLKKADDPVSHLLGASERDDSPTWISVLSKDRIFAHDPEISGELKKISTGLKSGVAEGNFLVEGEIRYLSRDLLHFLIRLLDLMNEYHTDSVPEEKITALKKENLYQNRFYMPASKIKLWKVSHCAIFRSPHLSRNEQCALQPLLVSKDNIYYRYFSHLSGVLMVAYKSLEPQALGGADFDGDQVKIISNKHIVNAVLAGAYRLEKNKYVRKLPIISIPSPGGVSVKGCNYDSEMYYKTIKNTFSNNVGQISNLAIRLGQVQYASPESALKHTCAECTIFTGLEIDAAKSGVHPNLSALIAYCNSLQPGFEYIEDFRKPFAKHNEKASYHEQYKAVLSHTNPEDENAFVQPLALLPYYYMEHTQPETEWKPAELENEKIGGRYQYFTFLNKRNWKSDLDNELLQNINAVIAAYQNVLKISRNVNNYVNTQKNSTYAGFIHTIIQLQYDTGEADMFLNETYMILFQYLDSLFASTDELRSAIGRLRSSNWPFLLQKQREDALMHILGTEQTGENKIFDYLTNFDSQGYHLLFYFLHDVLSVKAECASTEETAEFYKEKLSENISDINQELYRKMFDDFFDVYLKEKSFMKPDRVWRMQLLQNCKEIINGMLSQTNSEMRIKTLYASKNRSFFWDYFSKDDLLPYLYQQEDVSC